MPVAVRAIRRKTTGPAEMGFVKQDHKRLATAMKHTNKAREYRRLQAVWLVAQGHTVADVARLTLVWLPKQCSELNSMDHLWRELKGKIATNRQFANIDAAALHAEKWVLGLTKAQALRKLGVLSKNFWLKDFCQ